MTNNIDSGNPTPSASTWQLNALTEALGELTLTVDDSLSIGRGSDNDVVLGSKQVSRNHAVLSVLDGQLYVKDLDSSNGTFINEQRIEGNQSSLLQVDDTIGFASFRFLVNAPVAAEEESLIPVAPVAAENAAGSMNTADDNSTEADIVETTTKADEFEEYIIEHPTIDEPVVKETGIEDMLPATDESVKTVAVDTASEVAVESTNETPDTSLPIENAIETVEPAPQEPIVKEKGIEEVLSAAESVESAPIEDTPELIVEAALEEPVVAEEPVMAEEVAEQEVVATEPESLVVDESEPLVEQSAVQEEVVQEEVVQEEAVSEAPVHEEPVVEAEHDKTTTTELQEEADPDVLRAKQAATAQFSGTANLGQSRDLGTEGNNAANQAVNNPANAGHIEKKPSGGWFIWVFVAILIVGLALWLFNKGVV